jgi:replication initiation protein RepC
MFLRDHTPKAPDNLTMGTAFQARSRIAMPGNTQVASFRRVSPGIVASARLAMANDVPDITKSEIALLLKRAAPIFGIDGTTYHVMDILLGLSRADDWKGGRRPIVAISNAKLAEYTMRSERTVIRCIRRLVEAGLASYRDSPTGRRFIYRNDNGDILAGYGIDFTPARVRAVEIRAAVDEYQIRLQAELAAKRDVARLSRAIQDLCDAFPEQSDALQDKMKRATEAEGLEGKAIALRELHVCAVEHLTPSGSALNLTAEGDTSVISITNTNLKPYLDSKTKRPRSNERETNTIDGGYAAKMAFEKKPTLDESQPQELVEGGTQRDTDQIQAEVLAAVSIGLLQSACREAQSMTGLAFDGWSSLARSGETLRRMIGLSEAGWADGCNKVGPYAAAAILATVLEKSIRDPDQIAKPGGYFRAMIDRAIEGELKLERSLFGLADGAYGRAP